MKMRCLLLIIGVIVLTACKSEPEITQTENWNNGYCVDDGGRLNYVETGSRTHYVCEVCGKEYTFGGVMNRKESED